MKTTYYGHWEYDNDGLITINGVEYRRVDPPRPKFVKGMVVRATAEYHHYGLDGGYGIVIDVDDLGTVKVRHSNRFDVDSSWSAGTELTIIIDPRDDE